MQLGLGLQADAPPAQATTSRRSWLRGAVGLLAASTAACATDAEVAEGGPATAGRQVAGRLPLPPPSPPRSLKVRRQSTGESFNGVYWADGRYVPEAMAKLNEVFRDPARDAVTAMDPRLFDILNRLTIRLGSDGYYDLLSGYRTPATNAATARRSRGVSTVSLHMSGMAADVRLEDQEPLALARLAAQMQTGGVGLYRSGFVHLDCGPARRW